MRKFDIQLRERWTDKIVQQAIDALHSKDRFPFAALQEANAEYIDLRGIPLPEMLKRLTIKYVDFSHSKILLNGQTLMCKLFDCRFTYAQFGTNLDNYFERCDFSRAQLQGALFRGVFKECSFVNANLARAKGNNVCFKECDFSHSKFDGTSFTWSVFENCTMSNVKFNFSSLGGSRFLNTSLMGVDLRDTLIDGTRFD